MDNKIGENDFFYSEKCKDLCKALEAKFRSLSRPLQRSRPREGLHGRDRPEGENGALRLGQHPAEVGVADPRPPGSHPHQVLRRRRPHPVYSVPGDEAVGLQQHVHLVLGSHNYVKETIWQTPHVNLICVNEVEAIIC